MYSNDSQKTFESDERMSRQFWNLKTHLFDHLQTPTHLEKQKEITDVETGK